MFRAQVLIVRRPKLYYTVFGTITPVGGRPVHAAGYKRWSLETPCEQEYEKPHELFPSLTTLGLFILILTNLMH